MGGALLDNQWAFTAFVAVVLLGLTEAGYRLGYRLFVVQDEARKSQISGVQGAVLGLLGLLLGFTFSMAVNRFEIRRDFVLQEANAIGTTWLRAGLLPEAHRAPVKTLLGQYTEVRIQMSTLVQDSVQIGQVLQKCAEIENTLWQHAEKAAAEAPTPITATFITALNDMIDTDAARLAAHRNRIPAAVWILLILVAAAGCLTTGYLSGSHGTRSFFAGVFLPLLIVMVIMLIFDLMHPQQGLISFSQRPLLDLQQSMKTTPSP